MLLLRHYYISCYAYNNNRCLTPLTLMEAPEEVAEVETMTAAKVVAQVTNAL